MAGPFKKSFRSIGSFVPADHLSDWEVEMLFQQIGESTQDARLAVSVIPLRESDMEPELFVQHRVSTMDFAAGMIVFPGGRADGWTRTNRTCSKTY